VLGIVVNRVTGDKSELKLQDLTNVLGLPVIASLPEDVEVRRAAAAQQPVEVRAPDCGFSRGLRVLASALTHEPVPEAKGVRGGERSLFERLNAFFARLFGGK
jgi:septum site-determining protein MinD